MLPEIRAVTDAADKAPQRLDADFAIAKSNLACPVDCQMGLCSMKISTGR
jgi:hypothetical protein